MFECIQQINIKLRYINTKDQIADLMTKGSFTQTTFNTLQDLAGLYRLKSEFVTPANHSNNRPATTGEKGASGLNRTSTGFTSPYAHWNRRNRHSKFCNHFGCVGDFLTDKCSCRSLASPTGHSMVATSSTCISS